MAYLLILIAVALRLIVHPANFAPVAAIALFSGVYLDKKYSIIVPLAAMFISDLFIGVYTWQIMASVYLSFALIGAIGLWVRKHKKVAVVLGASLTGSILFYLVTNFAVWAFGTMYTPNLQGLINSYIAAIPFFRNTLMGDLFYVGLLFGSYEFSLALSAKKATQRA